MAIDVGNGLTAQTTCPVAGARYRRSGSGPGAVGYQRRAVLLLARPSCIRTDLLCCPPRSVHDLHRSVTVAVTQQLAVNVQRQVKNGLSIRTVRTVTLKEGVKSHR